MNEPKYYCVSSGDGNDGVSRTWPHYIVKTDNPWLLAELAGLSEFKEGEGQQWAKDNMKIDGDEEYGISVVFMESPETQEERQRLADEAEENDEEFDLDGSGCDYAWLILEIFPMSATANPRYMERCPLYESLEDCFGKTFVKANKEA